MTQALDALAQVLKEAPLRLVDLSEEDASRVPANGGWSPKQVLGHLIDSASNNHQRWVRALGSPRLVFPAYEQEFWVAAQPYATEPWPDLVNLWLLFNRHLLQVARQIPANKRDIECRIGDNPPMTLEALVISYVEHLKHHLNQIADRTRT
jgi:hypothetical protein